MADTWNIFLRKKKKAQPVKKGQSKVFLPYKDLQRSKCC